MVVGRKLILFWNEGLKIIERWDRSYSVDFVKAVEMWWREGL